MTETGPRTTFLSLPTELRLQIAAYALEQWPDAGLTMKEVRGSNLPRRSGVHSAFQCLDPFYRAASNLSVLLVCRQFRLDFTRLAFEKTRFILTVHPDQVIADQTDVFLQNVRKLAIRCRWLSLETWGSWPFNVESIYLDELIVAPIGSFDVSELVRLLRRLRNVKMIKIILDETSGKTYPLKYYRLVGAVLKEDHYQRYDAPMAPQLESTWWDWSYNKNENCFLLVAQEPKPIMEEEAYMVLMKPKVDEVMEGMERWHRHLADDESETEAYKGVYF
ncbi:hypothetical protein BKA66DRAFT_478136 [Pyrenochaeta sp. MPI-SDFR-AT-0127]|nr:hypothetical protein BKA66DRAFT_478136 [Pyrenochaeta sp. MPI-SDFR-AT-0127]